VGGGEEGLFGPAGKEGGEKNPPFCLASSPRQGERGKRGGREAYLSKKKGKNYLRALLETSVVFCRGERGDPSFLGKRGKGKVVFTTVQYMWAVSVSERRKETRGKENGGLPENLTVPSSQEFLLREERVSPSIRCRSTEKVRGKGKILEFLYEREGRARLAPLGGAEVRHLAEDVQVGGWKGKRKKGENRQLSLRGGGGGEGEEKNALLVTERNSIPEMVLVRRRERSR